MSSQGHLPTSNITFATVQIAFLDAQDVEKDFAWPFDTLKHRFIDFIKVLFLRRPEGRLRVLKAIRLLENSFPRLRPIRFFGCPGCRK
jgi:hypothetical protein